LDKISAEGIMKSEEKRVEDIDITSVALNVTCQNLPLYPIIINHISSFNCICMGMKIIIV